LEEATKRTDKRASQLKAVTEVARAIASIRDINQLLPSITRLISQEFNFYHVGIFLLDERGSEAILRAANSEGGRKMLERGHRLRVGKQGIVGYAAAEGKPGIALDTGENAIFFNNPDLPLTRSEIALPLIAGSNIIGVLDVQSEEPSAFGNDDIEVLLTLAYQVAIAIQNASLFSQTMRALEEFQSVQHQLTGKQWEQFLATQKMPAFKFSGFGVETIEADDSVGARKARESGKLITTENEVAVPIILRGKPIGILNLKSTEEARNWDSDEMKMAQAAAERVAVAIENARLIDETQKRAARERAVAEMSAKIAASIDVDTILKSTAQELGKLIQNSEITVRLGENTNLRGVE
jgi:GAF domain-containing protein